MRRRRSGRASRTHFIWGFARISERPAGAHARTSTTRASAIAGRPTRTFATGVAPAATGCPCRTTGPCASGRETSAPSAGRRASRSASTTAMPPTRCGACCAATATSASATTRTIPSLPGPRRCIWKRHGAMTGISGGLGRRLRFDFTISCLARACAGRGRKPGRCESGGCFRGFYALGGRIPTLGGIHGTTGGNLKGIYRKIQGRPHVRFKRTARTVAKQHAMGRSAHRRRAGGWIH